MFAIVVEEGEVVAADTDWQDVVGKDGPGAADRDRMMVDTCVEADAEGCSGREAGYKPTPSLHGLVSLVDRMGMKVALAVEVGMKRMLQLR